MADAPAKIHDPIGFHAHAYNHAHYKSHHDKRARYHDLTYARFPAYGWAAHAHEYAHAFPRDDDARRVHAPPQKHHVNIPYRGRDFRARHLKLHQNRSNQALPSSRD